MKLKMMKLILSIVLSISVVNEVTAVENVFGQQINDEIGGCDQSCRVTPAHFFNITAYAEGVWYMHSFRMLSDPAEGIRPASHRYIRANSNTVTETSSVFSINSSEFPSIWRIRSNGVANNYTHSVILHTNYVDWSLVYTCSVQHILGRKFRLEFVSVYTRERFIDDILDDFTKTLLTSLGFPPEKHSQMNQNRCM